MRLPGDMLMRETVLPASRTAVSLVVTPAADYNKNLCLVMKELRERFGHGVVVTANRPYHVLMRSLRQAEIPHDGLEFIDCISAMTGQQPPSERGVTYVDGPLLLEMIAMRAQQLMRFMPDDDRFMLMDSVSTLCLYNGPGPVTEMAHTLTTRLRLMETGGVLFALDDPRQQDMIDGVAAYCDHVVKL